jgi:hypothetical protein
MGFSTHDLRGGFLAPAKCNKLGGWYVEGPGGVQVTLPSGEEVRPVSEDGLNVVDLKFYKGENARRRAHFIDMKVDNVLLAALQEQDDEPDRIVPTAAAP